MFGQAGAGDELAFERVIRCRVWDAEDEVPPGLGSQIRARERPPGTRTSFSVKLYRGWRTEPQLARTTYPGQTARRGVV